MNVTASLDRAVVDLHGHRVIQLDDIVSLVRLGEKLKDQGNAVLLDRENRKLYVWRIEDVS